MPAPTVSVLIPCFNAAKYIEETLDSIYRQTWRELEIIVVDDGSEDDSVSVIERHRGVQLIRQANAGAAAARNQAYLASRGSFIQFLDADDLIEPEKIERQMVRLIEHPDSIASAEWGRFHTSSAQTQFEPEPTRQDLDPLDWLAAARDDGLPMMFPALWLMPRAVADSAGPWDETLSLGDDGEYFTRALLAAKRVLFCLGARCHYRSGVPGSLSSRKSKAAWASEYRVISLSESHVRERKDTERVRRGFALSWQHFAHACYPYDRELAERALKRAQALHPTLIRPQGGTSFMALSMVLGWRNARRLQVALGRS